VYQLWNIYINWIQYPEIGLLGLSNPPFLIPGIKKLIQSNTLLDTVLDWIFFIIAHTTTSQSLETTSSQLLMETRPSQKILSDSVEIGPSKSLELEPCTFSWR
jgi:hypothetical protein